MSELRVGAAVHGTDGDLGRIDALIIDPVSREISHLVLEHSAVEPRRMVPVGLVTAADPGQVTLSVDDAGLHALPRFDEPAYNVPDPDFAADELVLDPGSYFLEPFATPLDGFVLADHERIPKGEVAVRRGTEVVSSDGTKVGHVDEFLVDPTDGSITHLVLRQGHLLRRDDDVVIPVRRATRFEDERVVLDLDLPAVEALEKIPVKRHGHVRADDGLAT